MGRIMDEKDLRIVACWAMTVEFSLCTGLAVVRVGTGSIDMDASRS